jgi:RNA polymerase sigma-70 factor (ECF subfamily)
LSAPSGFDEFERIYNANVGHVYNYVAVRLGPTEAEDVTATVFHAAVVAWRDGRRERVTPAWLMAVTKNKVIDRWRQAERRRAKTHLLAVSQTPEWPDAWSDPAHRQVVLDCLDKLSAPDRVLLILRHVDGLSVREIAAEAGRTITAVESQLARARRGFRRHYEDMEERDRA